MIVRLGGHFAHVHDESIDTRHDETAGEAWLHGRCALPPAVAITVGIHEGRVRACNISCDIRLARDAKGGERTKSDANSGESEVVEPIALRTPPAPGEFSGATTPRLLSIQLNCRALGFYSSFTLLGGQDVDRDSND